MIAFNFILLDILLIVFEKLSVRFIACKIDSGQLKNILWTNKHVDNLFYEKYKCF